MRKAAGILMIIFGAATIGIFVFTLRDYGYRLDVFSYASFIITLELIVFFIIGGVFCFKRKYWALCFISSLFLHIWVMVSFPIAFFPDSWLNFLPPWFVYFSPVGILPFIFIVVRKREWQEQEYQG